MKVIDTLIFDLGGVLIDWNPEYLFKKIFSDEEEMKYFLNHICTPEWNEQQDGGRRLLEATELLTASYPKYELPIRSYYGRWAEMLGGPIEESVDILSQIKAKKQLKLFALTNWSAETFPIAYSQYEFLKWFEDILVSGQVQMRKPFSEIYLLAKERFNIQPGKTLFIDDNLRNIRGAQKVGYEVEHFTSPATLKKALQKRNLL